MKKSALENQTLQKKQSELKLNQLRTLVSQQEKKLESLQKNINDNKKKIEKIEFFLTTIEQTLKDNTPEKSE